jgi:hypothetical protein
MGLELGNGTLIEKPQEKVHDFQIPTPHGIAVVKVPHSAMKICACGCDRYVQQFHVTWGKPQGVLGAQAMLMQVQIFVCAQCGRELSPNDNTVGQAQQGA